MSCPRKLFEELRDKARLAQAMDDAKRHHSAATINGWKADVYEAVLRSCVSGLCIDEDAVCSIVLHMSDTYNITYEGGRKRAVALFLDCIYIPA